MPIINRLLEHVHWDLDSLVFRGAFDICKFSDVAEAEMMILFTCKLKETAVLCWE